MLNKQSTRWYEKSQFRLILKEDKSVDSSWKRRWYWNFGTLQKSSCCSETANFSKTWSLEKKLVRQIRKEFCYTSRRLKERSPNWHMQFKILNFSVFYFNVSLKLDLSLKFFQQIDLIHFPQQSQLCNEILRKPLFANSSFCRWRKKGSEKQFQYKFGCDNLRVIFLNLFFLSRSGIN